MTSFSIKNYNKPRPVWMRVIGDSCVYASSAITGISIANNEDVIAYISLGLGVIGYFFTKMFAAITEEYTRVEHEIEETESGHKETVTVTKSESDKSV